MRYNYTAVYIASIILVNTLFSVTPPIVLLNSVISPIDVLVGCVYVFRDLAQREIKHYILIAMLIATGVSYLLADKTIAMASALAFFVGEMIDWLIYSYTKKPLSERLLWSSLISSPIDSIVFLYVANSLNLLGLSILVAAKIVGVYGAWYYWRKQERVNA